MSHKIRKALDKLIGTEKIFTHKDKEAIYSKIEKEEVDQMKSRRKKWGIPFIYGLTAALLFVLVWAGIPHNKTPEKESSVHETSKVQKTSSTKKKQPNQQSLTLGASKHSLLNEKPKLSTKEAKQYPKKFQIVKKMYYSWDHIHNIQGQIEAGYPQLKVKGETTFYLDLDHQRNWAKQLVTKKGNLFYMEKVLYKDHKITLERPKKKIFTEWRFQNQQKVSTNVYEGLNFEDGNVTNSLWFR
ncbi:MAG TPA: hypothetical protein VFK37_04230, partial [Bacillales bacterium]|nr:hypothetical protein [Bacillales bacterium]